MKRSLLILAALVITCAASMAQKYMSKTGYIAFLSDNPLERMEGKNNQVATILDATSGVIAFDVIIKSFKFDQALLEEHFNENYMESAKFPKSTFKGKITNLSTINFKKDGTYPADIEGDLTIHGVTKHIKEKGTLAVAGEKIVAKSNFGVKNEDYNITIPAVVKDKFAKVMQVTVNINYQLMK